MYISNVIRDFKNHQFLLSIRKDTSLLEFIVKNLNLNLNFLEKKLNKLRAF